MVIYMGFLDSDAFIIASLRAQQMIALRRRLKQRRAHGH